MAEPQSEVPGTGRLVTMGTGDASFQVWVPNEVTPVQPTGQLVTIGTGDASFQVDSSEVQMAQQTLNTGATISPSKRQALEEIVAGAPTAPKKATTTTTKTGTTMATTEVLKQPDAPVFAQGGEERAAQVGQQVATNLTAPQLPAGSVQTATQLEGTPGQFQTPATQLTDVSLEAQQATGATQEAPTAIDAVSVDASLVGQGATAQAAQRELPDELTTSGRLAELLQSGEDGGIPAFAQPALAQVDRVLAARGLSRTSIGADQLTNMLITTAIPLAQADSAALVANFQQNLSNEQQAAMANAGFQQQILLSDQSSQNAAEQFNASSQAQTDQFMSSLKSTIEKGNADRITAISQFNAQQGNAFTQYSKQLEFNRDQFNTQNAIAIEQSNVAWRRDMNKINTQATNAANQANAMNSFNMSNQALTFMWQEMRDAAKWTFEANQNDKQRAAAIAQAALGNEAAGDASKSAALSAVAGAALNLWAKTL